MAPHLLLILLSSGLLSLAFHAIVALGPLSSLEHLLELALLIVDIRTHLANPRENLLAVIRNGLRVNLLLPTIVDLGLFLDALNEVSLVLGLRL